MALEASYLVRAVLPLQKILFHVPRVILRPHLILEVLQPANAFIVGVGAFAPMKWGQRQCLAS